mgnify:CR=1 FL=1
MPSYIGQIARWSRAQSDRVEGLYLSPIPAGARDYTASVVADMSTTSSPAGERV